MDRDKLRVAVENGYIEWQKHALEQMIERGITRETVKEVLSHGEIIEDYPDDKPSPSALFSGWIKSKPFHVVAAFDSLTEVCFVITAYKPDLEHFESDYKTRRKK
ncbi:MAG: DUF4258 domain-containing protein [Nitrospirae bacterium]|nr:DUF4258 domain-containing protein [Nitrospirota bacterium]